MATSEPKNFAKAVAEYAGQRLGRLADHIEKAVAGGDIDAIHDLRVASRRVNEPLSVMAPWLGTKTARHARRRLTRIRDCFQLVRDLDVLQASLAAPQGHGPLDTGDLAQLEGLLTKQRERAIQDARRNSEAIDCERIIADVEDLADRFLSSARGEPDAVAARLREVFEKRARELLNKYPADPQNGDLHRTRICVKKLRYCADLASRIDALSDAGLIPSLTGLQEMLGRWNDELFAARWFAKIARRRRVLAGQTIWARRVLEYAAVRLTRADELRNAILAAWPGVAGSVRACPWSPAVESAAARTDNPVEAR